MAWYIRLEEWYFIYWVVRIVCGSI